MDPYFQLPLRNKLITLLPLEKDDFEETYAAASNPLIWEQHPNPDRYKKEVFTTFFEGALASKGAYKVVHNESGLIIGSSRFCDYNPEESIINIGYTFISRAYWGVGINPIMKDLMLRHAFVKVKKVQFRVGECNKRSQIAVGRLGAKNISREEVAYYGESAFMNYVYELTLKDYEERPY
jgi:N-acetyltransferase